MPNISAFAVGLRVLAACAAFALLPLPAVAQDVPEKKEINCARCHDDVSHAGSVHEEQACQACHTNVEKPRHKAADLADLTGDAICAQCHGMAARQLPKSVHGGAAACVDCHGEPHDIRPPSELASTMSPANQIKTCGGCHGRQDGLVEAYIDSVHGQGLLRSGLTVSPSCATCHGNHRILPIEDDKSATSDKHAPELCGSCHALVLDEWKTSAHGAGWTAGNEETPVCTTCHESHAIGDPTVGATRLGIVDECGDCHGELYTSYRGSFHGKASHLGMETAATCSDCHTPHANLPAADPASSIHPDNLDETCGNCHEGMSAGFLAFDPHNDPTDPNDNAIVYWVFMLMIALLLGVFGFFGIHAILWLQRAIVGAVRGEYAGHHSASGQYVRRFRKVDIRMHILIIVTFLTLAATGLPLKFDNAPWAITLVNLLGGPEMAQLLHRLAAIGTFGYFFWHLSILAYRFFVKREKGLFWGPNSMTPQLKDGKDLIGNIKYFLYLGPRPAGDRWTYWEKFDYLAVFWGMVIIGLSGLMLWFPGFFTSFLPGWVLNAAYVVHSDEALLATGFIFLFHFFHTHLRPESFPLDPVVFTGSVPLERFKDERPLEYQRMVDNGTLEAHLVPPPTKEQMTKIYILGFVAVAIGLALAVGIFIGLLGMTH